MTRKPPKPRNPVLTLARWLVVIAIVAALGASSIPVYKQYGVRVTRTDAQQELLALAQRLQRCFMRTGNYMVLDNAKNSCVSLPQSTPEGTYLITGDIAAKAFLLTATPEHQQSQDTECGAFTLDQLGERKITGTGTAAVCWEVRRN